MFAAANNEGFINVFPMLDTLEKESGGLPKGASNFAPVTLNEVVQLRSLGDCSINTFEYSPFIEGLIASG